MRQTFFCFLILPVALAAQTPCINGMAGNYPCNGVHLMAQVTPQELGAESIGTRWINDIWGWTDAQTGKEYALVGMTNGTSFVDISNPASPIVLGVLREHNWDVISARYDRQSHEGAKSVWRDIKVYGNYAYIVSEDADHGIQVFDLTELRTVIDPPVFFSETGHYDGVGAVHNIFINESTGFLYAVGFNDGDRTCSIGGLHIVDLADPVNPEYAGCYDTDGYVHDTQCVVYQGPDLDYTGQEICFNSNANGVTNTLTIVNVNDKENNTLISKGSYSESFFTHQGWLTEDQRYFISNDELDEINTGHPTKTFIWNVSDLDNPILQGTYTHDLYTIDHNLYIKGNKIYESNYTSGLRILNLLDIEEGKLSLDLFFDTYPADNSTEFWGTWSNYPFFASGNIIVSDFTGGLFILDPLDLIFEQQPTNATVNIGEEISIDMSVLGDGLSFQWQVNEGSGFSDITDLSTYEDPNAMTLKILSTSYSTNGKQFRCVISDVEGNEAISKTMTLTVNGPLSSDRLEALKVFPNPVSGILNIEQLWNQRIEVELISMDGRSMLNETLTGELNRIGTGHLMKGMYLLKLKSDGSSSVRRISIE